jgi:hypothetical protein
VYFPRIPAVELELENDFFNGLLGHRTAAFEHARRAVTPVPTMKKPFDVLAEGLISKNSRDDKTAIELFLIGVRALALQSSIIDVVRIASRFSTATG